MIIFIEIQFMSYENGTPDNLRGMPLKANEHCLLWDLYCKSFWKVDVAFQISGSQVAIIDSPHCKAHVSFDLPKMSYRRLELSIPCVFRKLIKHSKTAVKSQACQVTVRYVGEFGVHFLAQPNMFPASGTGKRACQIYFSRAIGFPQMELTACSRG